MNKKQARIKKDRVQIFYLNEILSDLERKKAFGTIKDVGVLESPVVKIGVDKIQAKSSLGRFLVEYANNSTIHGLNQLAAPRRHICEKCSIGFTIIISLILLIFLSLQPWYRYQHEATVISLDTNYKNFNITSPSLTVCPIRPWDEGKFSSVFKRYGIDDTTEAREFFQFISKVHYSQMNSTPLYDKVPAAKWSRILYDLRPNVTIVNVGYPNNYTWVSTEYGICLTFANYVSIYASPEYWFVNNFTVVPEGNRDDRQHYNFRNMQSHITSSVKEIDFQMEVHYPDEIFLEPRYKMHTKATHSLEIDVDEFNSSSQIRFLTPQQRHCKFLSDGNLKMWPVYTYNMCLLECKYNKIYQACGCYPHFARPMKGIPVCNARQLRCIGTTQPPVYFIKNERKECNCLVNCNSAIYLTTLVPFTLTLDFPADSVLQIMLNLPLRKFIRKQMFGWTDFLISVGGACNLLLGASIISLVEIFYYASLRLFCYLHNLKLQKNRKSALVKSFLKKE